MAKRAAETSATTAATGDSASAQNKVIALSPERSTSTKGSSATPIRQSVNDTGKEEVTAEYDPNMGEFEDEFEDIEEDDENVIVGSDDEDENDEDEDEDEDGMDVEVEGDDEEDEDQQQFEVYLPGGEMGEDEVLEVDNSAYVMLHSMGMEWPALSFDFIKDKLGDNRTAYPATMYLATGSQADRPSNNEITIMKISQLCRTNKDDQVLSDNEDNEDEEEIDEDPALESRSIKHHGGVNRIRISQMNNSASAIAATWSDTGKVHLFDIQHHLNSLDTHGTVIPMSARKPIYTVEGHRGIEGYSLDFSSKTGSLLSGDCNGKIILTTRNLNTGNFVSDDNKVFKGHEGSVEDLQWSPSENTVFASCSSDKTIRIWDTRSNSRTPQLSILAHNDDVNVISWNNSSSHLIVSGCQDGSFNIWDIRTFISNKNITSNGLVQPMAMASFKWHTSPITSIEWHPIEESVIAVSGADDQLTLWDLSVEHDAEEAKRDPTMSTITGRGKDDATLEVPPQLLFIHQGQKDIKELHWHPQLPGTIVSTAFDGLNIFKTISI